MAILPAIQAGALRVGASLQSIGKGFRSTVNSTIGTSRETVARTRRKIVKNTKRTEAERKKQETLSKKEREELEQRRREDIIEGKNRAKAVPLTLKSIFIEKPMSFLQYMLTAWVIKNGPIILREIAIFTKKVRIFVGVIKRVPGAVVNVVKAAVNFATVFVQNVLNFDFKDRKKKIDAARRNFDKSMEENTVTFTELVNVWNRDEETLDKMIQKLDNDESVAAALENAGVEDFDFGTFPQNPMFGPQPEEGAGGGGNYRGGGGSGADDLFDLIGSGEGGYNSVNRGHAGDTPGGAKSILGRDLTDMTVDEVFAAQKAGKVFAVGKYQIVDYTMPGFVSYLKDNDVDTANTLFDASTQEMFKEYVINVKRPAIGKYLRGETDDRDAAAQAVAREFASVGLTRPEAGRGRGQSRYAGIGSNAASISPEEVAAALESSRAATMNPQAAAPSVQAPQPAAGPTGQLTSQVAFSDFSKTAAQGGRGAVGKTDTFDPTGTINSRGRPHMGVDIGTSGQRGWYCALKLNGRVSHNGWSAGGGWMLFIESGGKEYVFMHLARQSSLRTGTSYAAGTPIGEIGKTGRSYGEHLHYEVRVNNRHIDPHPYLHLIIIGKLPTRSQRVAQGNTNNSAAKATRSDQIASISSRQTGGTQKQTNVITVRQKEIVMVG